LLWRMFIDDPRFFAKHIKGALPGSTDTRRLTSA